MDSLWRIYQILGQIEKQGGNPVTYTQIQGFQEAIQVNVLLDLDFVRHDFTWTNGQSRSNNIQDFLDKALATIDRKSAFP